MASQSSTKQNGEAITEEVPGSIVTYTEEIRSDLYFRSTVVLAFTFYADTKSLLLEK